MPRLRARRRRRVVSLVRLERRPRRRQETHAATTARRARAGSVAEGSARDVERSGVTISCALDDG